MRRLAAIWTLLVFSLVVLGCQTPYGPYGATGGYKQEKLAENKYIVSFYGNGNTPGQKVWNYWIYRCAELTLEKKYDFFSITAVPKHTSMNGPDDQRLVEFRMLDPAKLARGDKGTVVPVYYYYYTTTVTTYSSRAIITMYKLPAPKRVGLLLDARTVKEMLTPYVSTNGKQTPPDKKNMLIRAMVEVAIRSHTITPEKSRLLEKALRQKL